MSLDEIICSMFVYVILALLFILLDTWLDTWVLPMIIVPRCRVGTVGAPEWVTGFPNFSEKEMCSPCILCHEFPERPYVIGDNHYGDARFMEWYTSWPGRVTDEDRFRCIC